LRCNLHIGFKTTEKKFAETNLILFSQPDESNSLRDCLKIIAMFKEWMYKNKKSIYKILIKNK